MHTQHLGSSLWGRNGGQSLEEGFLLLAGDETILAPTTAELNGAARRKKGQGDQAQGGCRNSLFCMAEVIAEV